jgi:hypothetical protein
MADFYGSFIKLETELSFVQDFHGSPDGGRYEQLVTAYTDQPVGSPDDVEANEFRIAATLGMNLRRYSESASYTAVPAPPVEHYFLAEPFNVANTGEVHQNAAHWAFEPGMTPIAWKVSRDILKIEADPALGGAKLYAAIERGVESWNDVFGYPVFRAELAGPTESFADDRKNFIIVDPDVSRGYAYADWRTNPNTGEIRGASVYFGGGFFQPFEDDPPPAMALQPKARTQRPALVWFENAASPLCMQWAPAWEMAANAGDQSSRTGAEKLERYIQHVVAHEVGHTLGLRHNFKGSLVPPTSSVMEYSVVEAAIAQPQPGSYDQQAIDFLYGRSAVLPTDPFCTDEDTLVDPNCVRRDEPMPDPIRFQIARFSQWKGWLLDGTIPPDFTSLIVSRLGSELLAYVRAGTPSEAVAAWTAALDGLRAPLADPSTAQAADTLVAAMFTELYIAPSGLVTTPVTHPTVVAKVANDAKDILTNSDGARTFPTRRLIVDALKRAQNQAAYLALLDARSIIRGQLGGMNPADKALAEDLLARIDAAVSPYFD